MTPLARKILWSALAGAILAVSSLLVLGTPWPGFIAAAIAAALFSRRMGD